MAGQLWTDLIPTRYDNFDKLHILFAGHFVDLFGLVKHLRNGV